MKIDFKKLLPHIIAIAVFFIVAYLFCKPAFEGKMLQQHDSVSSTGMAKNAYDYKEKFGHLPLWNTNLFSGMPNFQVAIQGPNIIVNFTKILTLGLPEPANFFVLACLCFYLLCIAFKCNPYVAMFGALAYAYSTYDPVIISAGHITKMLALAFAPGLIAGLAWLYNKKYWTGLAITTMFATMEVISNHPQINYYLFIAVGFMTLSYIIQWVKNKEWKHMVIALSLAVLCAMIGIFNSGVTFFTTYDYAKYTMRGGKTVDVSENGTTVKKKTTGLDKDYAFQYSFGKTETVTLMMPNAFGGSSSQTFDENSNLVKKLSDNNVPENSAIQLAASIPKYWGGIVEGTSGPVYLGAISCLLFIIGLVVLKTPHKWWILAAVALGIFMAWGKYFPGFNDFLFTTLPMYSKFRAPSMALVIPQLLVPLLAALTLQQILFNTATEQFLKDNFKKILYALGGIILLIGIIYIMNDYKAPVDKEIVAAYANAQGGDQIGKLIVSGLTADRKDMFGGDLLHILGFAILLGGLLYLRRRKIISSMILVIILIVISTGDLFISGKKYLGEDLYIDSDTYTDANFKPSQADVTILQDKDPHFRVYNLSPDRFNESKTSYYHRSIGGYHAAKLRLYQDLIETQLSKNPLNMAVLNMLDTKYFLVPDQQGSGIVNLQRNDSAMGAAWFVKQINEVNGPVEELHALDKFDPAQTVFIDKSQNANIAQPVFDSSAKITLAKYNNDEAEYVSDAKTNQFAVLSEIYYAAGWNVYVDGNKSNYFKVNYLLRGMPVPAGHHVIDFKFEPKSYALGYTLATWGGILFYLLILGGIYMSIKKKELDYSFVQTKKSGDKNLGVRRL